MEIAVGYLYNKEIDNILHKLNDLNNLLVASTDIYILTAVLNQIEANFLGKNWKIEYVTTKREIKENTLVVIYLDASTSQNVNLSLYYYLELANENNYKVILYTQNMLSIDTMERRVRSRFSNYVCALRTLNFDEYLALYKFLFYLDYKKNDKPNKRKFVIRKTAVSMPSKILKRSKNSDEDFKKHDLKIFKKILHEKENDTNVIFLHNNLISDEVLHDLSCQYDVNNDIKILYNKYLSNKYDIKHYSLGCILDILCPIHLIILLMSSKEKIFVTNVIQEFRKFVTNCKEMKNCADNDIFTEFCELIDYKLISNKGVLLIDDLYLRKFINSPKRPNFLKPLLNKVKL